MDMTPEFVRELMDRPGAIQELRDRQRLPSRQGAPPDPATVQAGERLSQHHDAVAGLKVENVEDLRNLARSLNELSEMVRDLVKPAVGRADAPLRASAGAGASFFGDQRVQNVTELVQRARNTAVEVEKGLDGVVKSLADTAKAVERVAKSFGEVRQLTTDRLKSMNTQLQTQLRGTAHRPTGGTPGG